MTELSGWEGPVATRAVEPDTNPYMRSGGQSNYFSNPFASSTAQMQSQVPDMQARSNDRVTQMYGKLNSFDQNSSGSQYPAMQNAYGLGGPMDQPEAVPGTASNPNYMEEGLTTTMPDSGSRGFNPWSLTGEANARGK